MAAFTRVTIRMRSQKRLFLDDYLLLFSCVCLTAATALLYYGTAAIYFAENLSLNPSHFATAVAAGPVDPTIMRKMLEQLVLFQRINWSYLALTWTSIFAVKFAFLAFFRHLVDRVPALTLYWKVVLVITSVIYGFCVCDAFISCSKLGIASREF